MRSLRMSPLMRRASPSGCGSFTRSSDDFAKGMTRPNSTSSIEGARTCGEGGDFVPVEFENHFLQRRRSHPGRGHPVNSESPLSTVSTPTRSTTRSTGETNADGKISDEERVHEKLQQMWDDGELSPRAPLDRSLGYISSPNNSGRGAASASVASECTSGGAQSCRQISQQQGIVAPLFINDVRALRQMAPFSSTEEQVLTRSQRRRSSANLLQQLVAAQPGGSVHLGHAEVAVQQEQGINQKEQRQQHETDSSGQLREAQCDISKSQQHQYASQTVVEALDLSVGQACGFNSLGSAGAVSRGTVARKRRASSPVVSTDSFSAHEYYKKSDGGLPHDGAPLYGGRKRLSAPRTSMQTLDTADATPASSKTPPRRSTATTAVPYTGGSNADSGVFDIAINCTKNNNSSSSSSTLESPFQKHPPPSPSDFPVSSPIGTSSYTPRREASAEPKRQTHQMQSHGASATSDLPAVRGPAGKDKQALSSPLRTSPRRTHGEAGPSFPPFQTPRGPCNVQEPQDDTVGTCIRQRASQRCPSPLPLVPAGTPNKRAVADQRGGGPLSGDACEQSIPPAPEGGHENARAIKLRAPSTKKVAVLPRRSSVVPASRLKAAPGSSNTSVVPVMSNREAETAKGVAEASGMNKPASSPRKTEIPVSTWHRPGRSGAPTTRVGVAERQRKSQLISAASPKYPSDRVENAPSDPHPKYRYPRTKDPGDSLAATALPRRRSTTRRSIGLASSAGPSSSWVPTSLADRRSASASPVASQDVTDHAPAQIIAKNPVQFAKGATTQDRMPMARLENPPSGAGAQSLVSSRNQVTGVCLGASIGEPSSTKTSVQGKAVTMAAVRKGLPRATPLRPSVAKPRANSSKSLFHSATARNSANMLPSTKPRVLIPASARHKTQGGGAVRGVRNSRGKYPTCNSCPRGVTSVAPSRHGRPAVKGHSPIRTKAGVHLDDSAATKSRGGNTSGFKVDAKDSGHAEKDACSGEFRSSCLSPPELSSASDEISLPQAQPELAFTEEEHRCPCTNSTICCPTVSSSMHSTAGIGVSASDACPALAQSSWDTGTPYHPSRRRSSSPHNLALQKCTSNEPGDGKRPSGPLAPLRRASSVCSLEDGDGKRISAQQQKNEALHREWEGRDREYQEKQQKLLLEQQRKERLLAWEQREAELLKNRKALSKEEPSFWGFDPFMVDEEDEKVLTTEELRVEVSRFLKGDLRFHSRADLLRVVKKFSEQTRTTTTTTSSRLNFTKVDQRVVPMAARQVHGTVPHERRRKSILRNSSGSQQPSEGRTRSRGISFSPFNKVQLYMLDEHERASKEAAAHLSQQGEQRQQLRQKLAHQFQLMLLRGDSDLELSLIRRELASLYDPDEEESIAFLSPTLTPGRDGEPESKRSPNLSQQGGAEVKLNDGREPTESVDGSGIGRLPFTVSPSWRQRQHNVWQDTPGASQTEPCAEWSPPTSPIEHSRLNNVGAEEGNGCWGTPIAGAGSEVEGKRELGTSENDENANYNAVKSSPHLHSGKEIVNSQEPVKQLSIEGPSKLFASEATRRPSVLRRRLSVVPNAQPT